MIFCKGQFAVAAVRFLGLFGLTAIVLFPVPFGCAFWHCELGSYCSHVVSVNGRNVADTVRTQNNALKPTQNSPLICASRDTLMSFNITVSLAPDIQPLGKPAPVSVHSDTVIF
jgi:hypothetical protein